MTKSHLHATQSGLIPRLTRADGHLRLVIEMIAAGKPCLDTRLSAEERAGLKIIARHL